MNKQAVELYKTFIDDVVNLRPCVLSRRIRDNSWPKTIENAKIFKVLGELTDEQREVFALITQSARDSGIHDVLVYLTDQINLEGMQIEKNGLKMATDPFDTGMHYDWVCRREGDAWPNLDD